VKIFVYENHSRIDPKVFFFAPTYSALLLLPNEYSALFDPVHLEYYTPPHCLGLLSCFFGSISLPSFRNLP